MHLSDPITKINGIGDELAKKFKKINVETVEDLIYNFPRRYEDYSVVTPIAKIRPGPVTIKAVFKSVAGRWGRRGIHVTEALASDESASARIIWFNQPYRAKSIKSGQEYFISGVFELSHQRMSIINPSIELASDFPLNTARIVPLYPLTKRLNSASIRKAVSRTLPLIKKLPDDFPLAVRRKHGLLPHAQAVESLHFPKKPGDIEEAKQRLGFEEVFAMLLTAQINKLENLKFNAPEISFEEALAKQFVANLPFRLTDAQRKVVWQIYLDIQKPTPANRLIEGDVGSGKTVVAVMAALMAIKQGYQAALMAPTEVLARQHAETVHKMLEALGMANKVGLLIGSLSPKQKQECRKRIESGDIGLIIGTHALIEDTVKLERLALAIIDEQHRFGVEQRKKLQAKAKHAVHVLTMSATPIPRSLALTLYGELDISLLDLLPNNRQPIRTKLVPPSDRLKVYKEVETELKKGRQCFVVCPQIEEGSNQNVSVQHLFKELSSRHFKNYRVGLLHGRLKPAEKDEVMSAYTEGKIDVLVATTVIEVGVDVPNASVMIIEAPARFGLAQIHQLRGRVGRGRHASTCYLMLEDNMPPGERLRAIEKSASGYQLAELDLKLRGPGAIYGQRQHGLLDLQFAKLDDLNLIKKAKHEAAEFIKSGEDLLKYPRLKQTVDNLRKVTNLN